MFRWQINACDGIYDSLDVHFTNRCDNRCEFCINHGSVNINDGKPDWQKMVDTIINNHSNIDDVLVLGGEPCLFLDELLLFVKSIKKNTHLKVFVTSSVPKTCYDQKDKFFKLLDLLDGFNISAQHDNESIGDCIRGCKSQYDRQAFYAGLPYKEKIRINLNLVSGFLDTRESIVRCVQHYSQLGFNEIRLTELQHSPDNYVSFEKLFKVKLPSPYSNGCQIYIDTQKTMGISIETPIILKRSCFVCEPSQKASFVDFLKLIYKLICFPGKNKTNRYGIVYEDGRIENNWLKGGE
jgi:pyruvate-formate lyase-activating enzyme